MYNNVYGNTEPTGVLGILVMMLPLLLVAAVVITIFGKKRNERKMSRFGVELEMIRKERHRYDSIGSHARAISKLLGDIRRISRKKASDLTSAESSLYDRLRHHVHQRYRLSKEQWKEYATNTRIEPEIIDAGYTHEVMKDNHKLVTDGSLSEGGMEMVTAPLTGANVSPAIQELAYVLRQGNEIDGSCGGHTHSGQVSPQRGWAGATPQDRWWMMRVNGAFNLIYSFFQPVIDTMVAPSRRGRRTYTAPLPPFFDESVTNSAGAQFQFGTSRQGQRRFGHLNPRYQEAMSWNGDKPNLGWGIFTTNRTGDVKVKYFAIDPSNRETRDHQYDLINMNGDISVEGKPSFIVNRDTNTPPIRYMDGTVAARKWRAQYKADLNMNKVGYGERQAEKMMAQSMRFPATQFDLACLTAYSMLSQSGGFHDSSTQAFNWEQDHDWTDSGDIRFFGPKMLRHNGAVWPEHVRREDRVNGDFRYTHVNPYSLEKYGTIEIRQHQGFLNPTKILMWLEFIDLLNDKAAAAVENGRLRLPRTGPTFYGMMRWLGFAKDDEFTQMWRRRISVINNDGYNKEHDIKCTTCGQHNCDRDNACGAMAHYDIESNGVDSVYGFIREYEPSCNQCGSSLEYQDNVGEAEMVGSLTAHCWCDECEEYTYHELDATWIGLIAGLLMGVVSPAALLVGCGIGLIHAAGKKWRYTNRAKALWIGLQERGRQAAGMFVVKKGKNGPSHWKGPLSSEGMIKSAATKGIGNTGMDIPDWLSDDTIAVVEHTRFATHGDNNKDNAHPHWGPNKQLYLVHNGVVHNHLSVWKDLGLEPTGPVDSQAVAAALEVGGIEKVVETCEGSMSLIWTDKRDPQGTVKFWTNGGNPLAFGRVDTEDGPVAVASTMDILEQTWALPDKVYKNHPDTGKRLKKKKWIIEPQTRLATSYSCTIGREYTIHPNGKITHRDIEGSAKTADYYHDWRSYATHYNRTYNLYEEKATGNADNCQIPIGPLKSKHYGIDMDEVLGMVWDLVDYRGPSWEPFCMVSYDNHEVWFDGYNGHSGQGIREYGDGSQSYYNIPDDVCDALEGNFMNDQFEELVWAICYGKYFRNGRGHIQKHYPMVYDDWYHQ
jgi:hypothetical protein